MWATIKSASHALSSQSERRGGGSSVAAVTQVVTDEALLHALRCRYAEALDLVAKETSGKLGGSPDAELTEMRNSAKEKLHEVIAQSGEGCSSNVSGTGGYRRLDSFYSECKQLHFLSAKNLSLLLYKEWERGGSRESLHDLYRVCMAAVEAMMMCEKVDVSLLLRAGRVALARGDVWSCRHITVALQSYNLSCVRSHGSCAPHAQQVTLLAAAASSAEGPHSADSPHSRSNDSTRGTTIISTHYPSEVKKCEDIFIRVVSSACPTACDNDCSSLAFDSLVAVMSAAAGGALADASAISVRVVADMSTPQAPEAATAATDVVVMCTDLPDAGLLDAERCEVQAAVQALVEQVEQGAAEEHSQSQQQSSRSDGDRRSSRSPRATTHGAGATSASTGVGSAESRDIDTVSGLLNYFTRLDTNGSSGGVPLSSAAMSALLAGPSTDNSHSSSNAIAPVEAQQQQQQQHCPREDAMLPLVWGFHGRLLLLASQHQVEPEDLAGPFLATVSKLVSASATWQPASALHSSVGALLADRARLQSAVLACWLALVRRAGRAGTRLCSLVQRLSEDEALLVAEICQDFLLSSQPPSTSDHLVANAATIESSFQHIVSSWSSLHAGGSSSSVADDVNMIRRLRVIVVFSLPTRAGTAPPPLHADSEGFWEALDRLLGVFHRVEAPHLKHWPVVDASSVKVLRSLFTESVVTREVEEAYPPEEGAAACARWLQRALPLLAGGAGALSELVAACCHRLADSTSRNRRSLPVLVLRALAATRDPRGLAAAAAACVHALPRLLEEEGSGNVRRWALLFLPELSASLDSLLSSAVTDESGSLDGLTTLNVVLLKDCSKTAAPAAFASLMDGLSRVLLLASSQCKDPLLYLSAGRAAGSCRALVGHICSARTFPEPSLWHAADGRYWRSVMITYTELVDLCFKEDPSAPQSSAKHSLVLKSSLGGDLRDAVSTALHPLLSSALGVLSLDLDSSALRSAAVASAAMLRANLSCAAAGSHSKLACLVNVAVCEQVGMLLSPIPEPDQQSGSTAQTDDLLDMLLDCHDATVAHQLFSADGGQLSQQLLRAKEALLDALYARTRFGDATTNDAVSVRRLKSLCLLVAQTYYYLFKFPLSVPSLSASTLCLPLKSRRDALRLHRSIQRSEGLGLSSRLEVRAALCALGGHPLLEARVDTASLGAIRAYYSCCDAASEGSAAALLTALHCLPPSGSSSSCIDDDDDDDGMREMLKSLFFDLFLYGGCNDIYGYTYVDPVLLSSEHEKTFLATTKVLRACYSDLAFTPCRYETWKNVCLLLMQALRDLCDGLGDFCFIDTLPRGLSEQQLPDALTHLVMRPSTAASCSFERKAFGRAALLGYLSRGGSIAELKASISPLRSVDDSILDDPKHRAFDLFTYKVVRKNAVERMLQRSVQVVKAFAALAPGGGVDVRMQAGSRIEGNWMRGGEWYPGRVLKLKPGATEPVLDIVYDDGEVERSVPLSSAVLEGDAYLWEEYALVGCFLSKEFPQKSAASRSRLAESLQSALCAINSSSSSGGGGGSCSGSIFLPYLAAKLTFSLGDKSWSSIAASMDFFLVAWRRTPSVLPVKGSAAAKNSSSAKQFRLAVAYSAHAMCAKVILSLLGEYSTRYPLPLETFDRSTAEATLALLRRASEMRLWEAPSDLAAPGPAGDLAEFVDGLWRILVASLEALSDVRRTDQFDYRSQYRLSCCAEAIGGLNPSIVPEWFSLRGYSAKFNASAALGFMHRLFDKKRSQLVAVWFLQTASTPLDRLLQRTYKYDHLRRKYITRYLALASRAGSAEYLVEFLGFAKGSLIYQKKTKTDCMLDWAVSSTLDCLCEVLRRRLQQAPVSPEGVLCARDTLRFAYLAFDALLLIAGNGTGANNKALLLADVGLAKQQLGGTLLRAYNSIAGAPLAELSPLTEELLPPILKQCDIWFGAGASKLKRKRQEEDRSQSDAGHEPSSTCEIVDLSREGPSPE